MLIPSKMSGLVTCMVELGIAAVVLDIKAGAVVAVPVTPDEVLVVLVVEAAAAAATPPVDGTALVLIAGVSRSSATGALGV